MAEGQQAGRVYRSGWLASKLLADSESRAHAEAFAQGLRSHGWIEGENITIVRRYAEGAERYPAVAAELATLRPDVIVTALGEPSLVALKNATSTIPIVMLVSADPVGTGLVLSLARPGGNITGTSVLAPEMGGKRLEILKRAAPKAVRVAVFWNTAYQGKADLPTFIKPNLARRRSHNGLSALRTLGASGLCGRPPEHQVAAGDSGTRTHGDSRSGTRRV